MTRSYLAYKQQSGGPIPSSLNKAAAPGIHQFSDNRAQVTLQRQMIARVNSSDRVAQLMAFQRLADDAKASAGSSTEALMQEMAEHEGNSSDMSETMEPTPSLGTVQRMPKEVQNLVGTSNRKCRCTGGYGGKWSGHWRKYTGLAFPNKCSVAKCGRLAKVGAHVRRVNKDGRKGWIAPFCHYHNKRNWATKMKLKKGSKLAPSAMSSCN